MSPALTSAGIKESASLYPIIDFVFVESIVSLRRKLWHFQIVVHIDDSGVFLPINRFDICPSSCAYRNLDNLKKLVYDFLEKRPNKNEIEVYEGEIGPVNAAHVGPAVGLAWIAE